VIPRLHNFMQNTTKKLDYISSNIRLFEKFISNLLYKFGNILLKDFIEANIPFCSMILAHLSDCCMILLFQNEGFLQAKNWSRWILKTSKDPNFLSQRKFFKER